MRDNRLHTLIRQIGRCVGMSEKRGRIEDIQALKQAIAKGDREQVMAVFTRAKTERDRFADVVGRFTKPGDME